MDFGNREIAIRESVVRENEADRAGTRDGFHGQLTDRAKIVLPPSRRRGLLAKYSIRGGWLAVLGVIGQGALFAGGLAIGAGIMLLRRGEPLKAGPGIMIVIGLGCLVAALAAQILSREKSILLPGAARG